MSDYTPLIVVILTFLAVSAVVRLLIGILSERLSTERRLASASGSSDADASEPMIPGIHLADIVSRIDEKKFGVNDSVRAKLRRDLIRAGYFSNDAVRYYIFARLGLVIGLPAFTVLAVKVLVPNIGYWPLMAFLVLSMLVGVFGVDAYLSRRQHTLQLHHRILFPDLVDMLVVCIDAGLSLNAALARITPEITDRSFTLAQNLALLGAETRAGRTMSDALGSFAERLNLDEVRSFAILLRQSFELGTNVADALRVFSDEMRTKRLLRAEEIANKLPVKMTVPLGAFIFPVVMMVIVLPALLSISKLLTHISLTFLNH